MKAIEEIKARLQNFPAANYQIKGHQVTIHPTSKTGFTVTLFDNEPHYTVGFNGWHEEYDDLDQALNCFAFGLSDDCRLKVSYRGWFAHAWTVEEKQPDGEWEECQWIGHSTTGLLIVPFMLKKRYLYLQNHLLKSSKNNLNETE